MKLAKIYFTDLEKVTLKSSLAGQPPAAIINALLPYIFSAAGILLLIYLVFGGFQFLTSGGDPGKTAAARSKITNALLGIGIVFTAYWIVQVVGMFLGISQIGEIF